MRNPISRARGEKCQHCCSWVTRNEDGDGRGVWIGAQSATSFVDQVDDLFCSGSGVAESMTSLAVDPCVQGIKPAWRRELSSESSRLSSRFGLGPRAWRGSPDSGVPTGR